ncbi:MAG: YbjN domain-containing protein [Actinomycetes bacterium]
MSGRSEDARQRALDVVTRCLEDAQLSWEPAGEWHVAVALPGERKLSTAVSLRLGEHSLSANAFVIRRPDDNHAAFYRWLLQRNVRLHGVAYALDSLGDVYLVARLPLAAVTVDAVDDLLGALLDASDSAFNTLLELGFSEAIRQEWRWRLARGESTANLAAFRHLSPPDGG